MKRQRRRQSKSDGWRIVKKIIGDKETARKWGLFFFFCYWIFPCETKYKNTRHFSLYGNIPFNCITLLIGLESNLSTHLRQGFSTLWRRQVGDGREWTPKVGRREKNKNIVCMSFKYEPRILDLRYASAIRSSQAVHHRSKRRERIEKVDTEKKKKKNYCTKHAYLCVCVLRVTQPTSLQKSR